MYDVSYHDNNLTVDEKFNYLNETVNETNSDNSKNDDRQESVGIWSGKFAKELGLMAFTEKIKKDDFYKVYDNKNPITNEKLTQNSLTDDEKKIKAQRIGYEKEKLSVLKNSLKAVGDIYGVSEKNVLKLRNSDLINPNSKSYKHDLASAFNDYKKQEKVFSAVSKKQRAAMELVYSIPKPVSVLLETPGLPENVKNELEITIQKISNNIDEELHNNAITRKKAQGSELAPVKGLAIANFTHYTARPTLGNMPDPSRHIHKSIANAVLCYDKDPKTGKHITRAIDTRIIGSGDFLKLQDAKANYELSKTLTNLGIAISEDKQNTNGVRTFKIDGLEKAVENFSKRTKTIDDLKEEHNQKIKNGETTENFNERIASLESRLRKNETASMSEIRNDWNNQFNSLGVSYNKIKLNTQKETKPLTDEQLIAKCVEKEVILNPMVLERYIYEEAIFNGKPTPEERLKRILKSDLLIEVKKEKTQFNKDRKNDLGQFEQKQYLSKKQVMDEAEIQLTLEKTRDKKTHNIDKIKLDKLIKNIELEKQKENPNFKFSEQQISAIRTQTNSNGVVITNAYAGSGKTTLTKITTQAYQNEGYKILMLAPTGAAAEVLEMDSGRPAKTIHKLDKEGDGLNLKSNKGEKVLVVVDEAGMCDQNHFLMLSRYAQKAEKNGIEVKFLFQGDVKQLPPVGAGNPLKKLLDLNKDNGNIAELTEIFRQKDQWQKDATIAIANGDFRTGIDLYEKNNRIHYTDTNDEALRQIAKEYQASDKEPHQKLVQAYRNEDVDKLNGLIRKNEVKAGRVKTDSQIKFKSITKDDNGNPSEKIIDLAIGERIGFYENKKLKDSNNKEFSVKNGNRGTILEIEPNNSNGYNLKVKMDETGKVLTIKTGDSKDCYNAIKQSYASTIHKSQGKTVKESWAYITNEGAALSYVALTRQQESTRIITTKDNKEDLIESMSKRVDKPNSSDYLEKSKYDDIKQDVNKRLNDADIQEKKLEVAKDFIANVKKYDLKQRPIKPAQPQPKSLFTQAKDYFNSGIRNLKKDITNCFNNAWNIASNQIIDVFDKAQQLSYDLSNDKNSDNRNLLHIAALIDENCYSKLVNPKNGYLTQRDLNKLNTLDVYNQTPYDIINQKRQENFNYYRNDLKENIPLQTKSFNDYMELAIKNDSILDYKKAIKHDEFKNYESSVEILNTYAEKAKENNSNKVSMMFSSRVKEIELEKELAEIESERDSRILIQAIERDQQKFREEAKLTEQYNHEEQVKMEFEFDNLIDAIDGKDDKVAEKEFLAVVINSEFSLKDIIDNNKNHSLADYTDNYNILKDIYVSGENLIEFSGKNLLNRAIDNKDYDIAKKIINDINKINDPTIQRVFLNELHEINNTTKESPLIKLSKKTQSDETKELINMLVDNKNTIKDFNSNKTIDNIVKQAISNAQPQPEPESIKTSAKYSVSRR